MLVRFGFQRDILGERRVPHLTARLAATYCVISVTRGASPIEWDADDTYYPYAPGRSAVLDVLRGRRRPRGAWSYVPSGPDAGPATIGKTRRLRPRVDPPLGSSGTFLPVKGSGKVATVTFDQATRVYPGATKPSVDKLDLHIEDGEFLVLVGPSGCGKSTSLRMLAGLEDVNEGRILIGDRDVTQMPPKDRDIAMVFQSYALYPHMTVGENMGFALKIAGVAKSEIQQRVAEAAKILDLTEYLDRKPKALSGGQRQRVAMGRAIVRQPRCS